MSQRTALTTAYYDKNAVGGRRALRLRCDVRRLPRSPMSGAKLEGHRSAGGNRARSIGDLGAVEEPAFASRLHPADAAFLVELGDAPVDGMRIPHPQCTILEMGSSMMSVAPWSFRAGMSVLMSDLGTTVSTA